MGCAQSPCYRRRLSCALGLLLVCLGVSAAPELAYRAYLPVVARPAPTPTPTPTPTPLPRLMDVRVEGPCCNFAGGGVHDPNGEWVCFRNYDSQPVDMNDWRVHDAAGHAYRFPPFVLAPGAIVRVHSGPGADIATDLYWGRGTVWNNDHDTVYLYDALSRLVSRYVY